MGAPNSEVGYTSAMTRREDHEIHKDMWWHGGKKRIPYCGISKHVTAKIDIL